MPNRMTIMLAACASIISYGCKKGDTATSTPTVATTITPETSEAAAPAAVTTGVLAISSSLLAAAYPEGLNITAFPTDKVDATLAGVGTIAVSTGLKLNGPGGGGGGQMTCDASATNRYVYDKATDTYLNRTQVLAAQNGVPDPENACVSTISPPNSPGGGAATFDPMKKTGADKLTEEKELLDGSADECFTADVLNALSQSSPATSDNCFQSDYGLLAGTSCTSSEVCLVSTSRGIVKSSITKVEAALGVMKAMLCQAKKDGVEKLPDVGGELDMSDAINKAKPSDPNAPSFTKAVIKRLSDSGTRPVYKTTIELTDSNSRTIAYNVAHSPSAEGNQEYNGVLWIKTSGGQSSGGNPNSLDATGQDVMSVLYARSGTTNDATKIKMEIRAARIKNTLEPFTSEGLVDYNAGSQMDSSQSGFGGFSVGQPNDYIGGITYASFDMKPITSEGTLAFWNNPGGSFTESARGFVFEVALNRESGFLEGCGIAGAANIPKDVDVNDPATIRTNMASIRQSSFFGKDLAPSGFYTPNICWAHSGDNVGTLVWKQCFTQGEDGVYAVNATKTTGTKGFDLVEASVVDITPPGVATLARLANVLAP